MLSRGVADLERDDARNLALIRGDATDLPFDDGSFDAVCCFAALHLFADPFAALDDMRRVLGDGGRIAIMTSVRRQLMLAPVKPLVERAAECGCSRATRSPTPSRSAGSPGSTNGWRERSSSSADA